MATDLLSKWLAHYDPIHRGWTPRGIANGVCATNGYSFPRVGGGYNLYRGTPDAESIDYSSPVGAGGADATEIQTFAWRLHQPSTAYVYALRSIGGGGVESQPCPIGDPVSFNGAGSPAGLRPNAVGNLSVRTVAGGAFEIGFDYDSRGQESPPVSFAVFADDGDGVVNYGSAIGLAPYKPRGGRIRFVTEAFAHGAARTFSVRALAADGTDDGATSVASAVADAASPPVHSSLFVELIDAD